MHLLCLMYHWSESNHEFLSVNGNDLDMWLNLDWTDRILRVPSSLISRLALPSSSYSSLMTLNFRVWVRLVDAENPWTSGSLATAFDTIDVTIGASPSQPPGLM